MGTQVDRLLGGTTSYIKGAEPWLRLARKLGELAESPAELFAQFQAKE